MNSSYSERTLYDDWKARRDRLAAVVDKSGYDRVQIQLLEYLLGRYEGSPEAQQKRRLPSLPGVMVNERAIIVHHHVQGRGSDVKNRFSAVMI